MQHLVVETREIAPVEDLLEFTDPAAPLAWLRRSDGFVGSGPVVWRMDAGGPGPSGHGGRLETLSAAWSELVAAASVDDQVQLPGTGLVAFGAFAFDEGSTMPSSLIVPSLIVGRHAGRGWVTRISIGEPAGEPHPVPYGPYWAGTLGPGALGPEGYQSAVRQGLDAIAAGEVGKVVLARELVGSVPAGADLRRLARALSSGYPDTWTYAVDGIIGASPETLVTVSGGTVTARVLAGTTPRGADADADVVASFALATSAKDLDEHEYAVQSVLAALRPHTTALAASEQPFTLKLPNVWHLATDLEGDLADGSSALELVRALHPTAAVAGSPTAAAIAAIRRIEPFDRGRYAGPVGWIDAHGDGEWAIALRCAQFPGPMPRRHAEYIAGQRVVAHAGAGIVAGSDPESELVETRVKFRPIVDALA
ncbi:isochorismate synthase [Microbacterium rhizosphaerae]|uniref:isochorismate synthase n=1 Tax=Microbacterium rhizosphaerae TaxID=1678237 RepID=A0ABZ0SIK2_9MICO|nr:isochorismate synthase [Microbacterium rhizosphaerae]WPR89174.1 isochorismate synthase [Microbacterium rhizosphaerae]